jgi:hypothetical protein
LERGEIDVDVIRGSVRHLVDVPAPAKAGLEPGRIQLVAELADRNGRRWENSWSYWTVNEPGPAERTPRVTTSISSPKLAAAFPYIQFGPTALRSVHLAAEIDNNLLSFVAAGGRSVVLLRDEAGTGRKVSFFEGDSHGFGTLVRDHPALGRFPHDGFMDLQFLRLVDGSSAIAASSLPATATIVVGGLSYYSSEHLIFVAEVPHGRGKLLVVSLNLLDGIERDLPEAKFLLAELLDYATSEKF